MNKWILILVVLVILVGTNYVYSGITGKTIIEELKETIAGTQEGVSGQVVGETEEKSEPTGRKFGVNITVLPSGSLGVSG